MGDEGSLENGDEFNRRPEGEPGDRGRCHLHRWGGDTTGVSPPDRLRGTPAILVSICKYIYITFFLIHSIQVIVVEYGILLENVYWFFMT